MYDYVIVGAGVAGCVLAARLSEDPDARVLLLEAGGRDDRRAVRIPAAFSQLFGTDADWALRTEPQPGLHGRRLSWPRGRMLGGSASLHAQMWVRGTAADYDAWAALGNRGWGFDDLLPRFRRAEDAVAGAHGAFAGRRGPQRVEALRDPNPATQLFVDACVRAGIPENPTPNDRTNEGVARTSVTQRRGRRWSPADGWLRPALRRPNLEVRTAAHATRIVLDRGRAVGVDHLRDVGHGGPARRWVPQHAPAAREVIVAAGAVHSPQLLQLSGIGPADALTRVGVTPVVDLPGVGGNLMDHLAAGIVVATDRTDSLATAGTPAEALRWLVARRGRLTSNVAEAHAFIRTTPQLREPDVELLFAPVPYLDHGRTPPPGHGCTIGVILQQPGSRGTVTLASDDPLDPPRIDPRYLADPEDLRVLTLGVRRALDVLATAPLAGAVTAPIRPARLPRTDAEIVQAIRAHAETLYHPVGTCRMGADADAVVDDRLRVHGVDGLRVADASVMPMIIRGHTQAPVVAIAETASDLIQDRTDDEET